MINEAVVTVLDYLRLRCIYEFVETIGALKKVVDRYDTSKHQYVYFPLSQTRKMLEYADMHMANFCLVEAADGFMWFEY